MNPLSSTDTLPADLGNALLVGRVWLEGSHPGPALVTVNNGQVIDITAYGPTMADLLERDDLQAVVQRAEGPNLGSVEALLENSQLSGRRPSTSGGAAQRPAGTDRHRPFQDCAGF